MKSQRFDRLIDVAAAILRDLQRPASAREIVDYGLSSEQYSSFFCGKTPQKTVNARISIDILKYGDKSQFFRHGPASYGLRMELCRHNYHSNHKKVYIGTQRRKQVSNELVAAISTKEIEFFSMDGLYDSDIFPLGILDIVQVNYIERKIAEEQFDYKQLVSYACILYEDRVLAFEKGKYTSDNGEFIGKQSIGFGGHLNHDDLSLFDESPAGFESNIRRELHEELYIFRKALRDSISSITFLGFLVDSSTDNGRKHLGLAACIKLRNLIELETPTLGIRNLRWLSCRSTPNSFDQFEIWSKYLFRRIQKLPNL